MTPTKNPILALLSLIAAQFVIAPLGFSAGAAQFTEDKITTADVAFGWFGEYVALHGDTLATNSAFDRVTVFIHDGDKWTKQQHISVDDGGDFGLGVALFEGTLAISEPRATGGGAVHIYVRSGVNWLLQQTLTADDELPGGNFGLSLSLQSDAIAIGAPDKTVDGKMFAGAVYVFERSGDIWSKVQRIVAPVPREFQIFGASVALNGDNLVVGGPFTWDQGGPDDVGQIYLYQRGGDGWTLMDTASGSEASHLTQFGRPVAIDGSTVAAHDPERSADTGPASGVVYVFEIDEAELRQIAKLSPSDPQPVDGGDSGFGTAISIEGESMLISAPDYNGNVPGAGAIYLFEKPGGNWTETQKIVASDTKDGDRFGITLSSHGGRFAAGAFGFGFDLDANEGAVYVFTPAEFGPGSGASVGALIIILQYLAAK